MDSSHGSEIIKISALQYAFGAHDTHARQIFFAAIKDNKEFIDRFLQQEFEQKIHINLQPLFSAYDNYHLKRDDFMNEKITENELEVAIAELGKMQSQILPWHLLRHMANPALHWSFFQSLKSPELDHQFSYVCSVKKPMSTHHFRSMRDVVAELNKGSALCRGIEQEASLFNDTYPCLELDKRLIEYYLSQKKKEHSNDIFYIRGAYELEQHITYAP